ncbi:Glycosyltransferase involved in cell wall bisynthesis [Chitinophaga costaii]|uniref:Glycosyltransferase involved in cell wall bisynthesis n=1 Tax=Chitinophaga costaii TaxID=1335309 RepID=A0A1C4D1C7_9BACT|nr:glycosyltransferase [Chitinophaga costaii]PUZ24422.1 glycosyltransferase [Chitinophaga costaii]SCC25254.1 Glycosyltransferase involved in cell wall bisynthesis [Chitinophaga costaii]
MKEEIKVSVIIATWNAAHLLPACLDSIAAVQVPGLEIVIADGGSKDNTVALLEAFKKVPLHYISEPDKGIYDALNKGVSQAHGKWLYFMGADDRLLPGFANLCQKLQDEHTVYYGNTVPVYGPEKPAYTLLVGEFTPWRLAQYCMNHQQIIYPASVFAKYQYPLKYKVFGDYALNLQVWGDPHFPKVFYPINIAGYYMGGLSSFHNDTVFKKDKARIILHSMGWWTYLRFLIKRFKRRHLQGHPVFF